MTLPKTHVLIDAAAEELLDNTRMHQLETLEKARKEYPWMTEEQLAYAWAFAAPQLRL